MRALVSTVWALVAGAIFGAGLVLGGMTQPDKVLAFLNVAGAWDPSLLFVMAGAIGVHALAYLWARRREAPFAASEFNFPSRRRPVPRLLAGAALFGVGWGIAGFCPGPSVVALASGGQGPFVFVAALLTGRFLAERWDRAVAKP
jgi:uncharacterized membrane protein YedE/YeeE